jgi:plasmid stabilization system protein ParE
MKELFALSSYALGDLFEIWQHIRQDNPEVADRVESELLNKCESLARMPGQGHRRPDYTGGPVLFFPESGVLSLSKMAI